MDTIDDTTHEAAVRGQKRFSSTEIVITTILNDKKALSSKNTDLKFYKFLLHSIRRIHFISFDS